MTFADCTHVIVSLLKTWKVTVVWIECHDAVFLMPLQEGTHHKLLAQEKNLNSASKVAYSQVSLLTLCYHWQTLSISFLLEMAIAKDH